MEKIWDLLQKFEKKTEKNEKKSFIKKIYRYYRLVFYELVILICCPTGNNIAYYYIDAKGTY